MKKYNILFALLSTFISYQTAEAYRPAFPKGPYYFTSENQKYLIEITPTVMRSRDSKHLLVKTSQAVSIYKKGDNNSWKEEGSFKVGRMSLIKEALVPNNGKMVVIKVDENPMARNVNKDDGIFVFSFDGKKIKSYSHFGVFNAPGIFRQMKLSIDNKKSELVISKDGKATRLAFPK